jgi:3-oxoacyl-[acyl-carrier protein] reductase
VARMLASAGADLILQSWVQYDDEQPWGSDARSAAALEGECAAAGARVLSVSADFAEADAPRRVIAQGREAFGHVDGVVVNHGRGVDATLEAITPQELDLSFAVNARASALLAKEFAAQHDGRVGGRLIFLTAGQHRGGMPGELPYVMTKGAVQQKTLDSEGGFQR